MRDPFGLVRSLILVTAPDGPADELVPTVTAALRGGVSHVLLRRPEASAGELFRLADGVIGAIHEVGQGTLLVHDRADVAVAIDAGGVHVPGHGLPGGAAKRVIGEQRALGISVHDAPAAVKAWQRYADYLFYGHVYTTPSHPGEPGRGVEALRDVTGRVRIPVIAIGGITPERVDDVLAAGAAGVAVIRAISGASDPEAAARELRRALDAADHPHLSPRKE